MNSARLLFLARHLPRRAARPLGGAWGRLAAHLPPGRRRRAEENLRRALPDLDTAAVRRVARHSFAHHAAALGDAAAVERLDLRRLCRYLRLDGWGHLDEGRGQGLVLLAPRMGLWRLAILVPALYRGSLAIPGALAGDPLLGRLAARFEQRLGRSVLETASTDDVLLRLGNGGRCAVLGEPPPALSLNAPIVPVLAFPEAGGRVRIVVREPLDPPPEADSEALARRCRDAVAREVHRRPELVAWWKMNEP